MQKQKQNDATGTALLRRYGCAVLSIALAIWVRLLLDPALGMGFPFTTLLFAVVFTAWYAGFGPALAAAILGALGSDYFLLPPRGSLILASWDQQAGLALYVCVSLGIALLGGSMQAARKRANISAQAEAAVRQSEDRFATAFRASPAAMAIVRASNGQIIDANSSFLHLHEYRREEVIDHTVLELHIFRDPTEYAAIRQILQEKDSVHNYEMAIQSKSGQLHSVIFSIEAISIDQEACFLISAIDITDRKQAEDQLHYQADLLNQVSDAIISTDLSFTIKSWNAAAENLYGWSAHEAIGRPLREIVPTSYPNNDGQQVQAAFLREGRWQGEVTQQRRDGEQLSIQSSVSLVKDTAGVPVGAVAINRDISQRKRAERALQRSADRIQHLRAIDQAILASHTLGEIAEVVVSHIGHLIPSTRVGVTLIDLSTRTMTILVLKVYGAIHTPASTHVPIEIFGPAVEPLLRGQAYQVADVAALPELPAFIRQGQAEQLRAYFHMPIMDREGLIALLNVGSDQPNAFSAEHIEIAREVADQLSIAIQQVRLREQIEHYAQELEQRVVERTAELMAANKELEAFSYSVSHDLRAPLRAIDGFSRILLEDYIAGLPDDAQRYFQLMRNSAQQMGQLIDDLLAFSRLSRQPLNKRSVDTSDLVRQCLDELKAERAQRPIQIYIGDLPACAADPALLKQVWFNLIANAIKYTRRREPAEIMIGCQTNGAELAYFVKDNGVGFDMRYSDKLFGVFQRMHRAEDYEGTGVGLAIVQRIIHRHGGCIWADAAVDQGATFYFSIGEYHDE